MKFVDFFAGAGMFRKGMELAGHECIGYVEIEKNARKTYEHNFNTEGEWTEWDVTEVKATEIPDADIWTWGFPCKNLSTANAVSRKGLDGEQSGLFWAMIDLLKQRKNKPTYLFVENVRGFATIKGGKDFLIALDAIHKLGYSITYEISSAMEYGIPQNRIRTYLNCKLEEQEESKGVDIPNKKTIKIDGVKIADLFQEFGKYVFDKIDWGKKGTVKNGVVKVESYKSQPIALHTKLSDLLEDDVDDKYYLNETQLEKVKVMKGAKQKLLADGRIWKEGAVPFPDQTEYARCITPSDGSLNRSTHIIKDDKGYRKLTIRERARAQGIEDSFEFPVSDSQASLQLGNGVCIPVITELAKKHIK